ncbi:MAG: MFS transporter permease [Desulfobacteraceae bacterium]|nr:MAG: MFS transporter permease [Desulfobacteraceae bacterium]
MRTAPIEIVIPREKAVFWLDRNGRWRNSAGPFRNPRIIDYFHAAIRRDAAGYYVVQEWEGVREKVYFPFEDTALFAVEVVTEEPAEMVLNTGRRLPLDPEALFIANDALYALAGEECIKFTDRAMMKLSDLMEFEGEEYYIRLAGRRHRIREKEIPPCIK